MQGLSRPRTDAGGWVGTGLFLLDLPMASFDRSAAPSNFPDFGLSAWFAVTAGLNL
jgi:hypothetical protein